MGDTGALALGGALGAVAILLKSEFLLVFIGGVFVAETTSVLIQRLGVQVPAQAARPRVRAGASRVPARAAAPPLRAEGVARDAGRRAVLDPRHPLRVRRAEHAQASVIRERILRGEVAVVGTRPQRPVRLAAAARAPAPACTHRTRRRPTRRPSRALAGIGVDARRRRTRSRPDRRARRVVVASPGVPPEARAAGARPRAAGVPIVSEVEVALAFLPGVEVHRGDGNQRQEHRHRARRAPAARARARRRRGGQHRHAALRGRAARRRRRRGSRSSSRASSCTTRQASSPRSACSRTSSPITSTGTPRSRSTTPTRCGSSRTRRRRRSGSRTRTTAKSSAARRIFRASARRFSLRDATADAGPVRRGGPLAAARVRFHRDRGHSAARDSQRRQHARRRAGRGGGRCRRTALRRRCERLAAGVRTFRALPHRLEVVAEVDGVLWIDDSKATNVSSARVAIEAMTRPTVVLLGGKHKNEPYTPLRRGAREARVARDRVRRGGAAHRSRPRGARADGAARVVFH